MVFNTVFKAISVISRRQEHLFMLSWNSFNQHSIKYSFLATGCFSCITIVEMIDNGEIGMNPVAKTITSPRKEYYPCRRFKQASSCSQVFYGTNGATADSVRRNIMMRYSEQRPKKTLSQLIHSFYHPVNRAFENLVGKGENAGNQHFLLFPQCFLSYQRTEGKWYQR